MVKLFLGTREISDVFKVTNTQTLNVTPTTLVQTITAPEGTGYSPVNVAAVTSAIDSNITAGNIKKNVTILGVTGTYETGVVKEGIQREVSAQGQLKMPTTSFTFSLPSNAIDVGNYAMYQSFYNCTGLTSVDLSSLTTLSGGYAMYYAFQICTGLTSLDLSSLTTISGSNVMNSTFRGCTGLTSVDLSSLTTISGSSAMFSVFDNCTGLTSVDLSSLTTISGSSAMYQSFNNCTGLTSVDLSSLTTLSGSNAMQYAFQSCTSLTSLSFPALTSTSFGSYTNQFYRMLRRTTGCTVHFPSNLQSVIGSWSDVTAGFGGTNTTVLFDLPATT